jgi:hypothetical protein
VVVSEPAALVARVREDITKWRRLAAQANIRAE